MHQFDLTDDQRQIQEMAQKFTADAITPFAAEWDEKHIFPRDTIRQAAELGFGSIYVSEESGGIGLGRLEAALIMEAMAYGCPSTSAFISIHNMASWMIDRFGSEELKQKYLPSLIPMERMASYCLTEPSSGSDAAALKTRAIKDGDYYVVSGSKAFISGGGENEIYVTMVRTGEEGPKGITALVIEKDMPGVSFGGQEKMWRARRRARRQQRARVDESVSDLIDREVMAQAHREAVVEIRTIVGFNLNEDDIAAALNVIKHLPSAWRPVRRSSAVPARPPAGAPARRRGPGAPRAPCTPRP